MKKAIIILLVSLVALGSVFAAKGELTVGAQAGYGGEAIGYVRKDVDGSFLFTVLPGFYGAATFGYGVTDALELKSEFGIIAPHAAFISVSLSKDDTPSWDEIPDIEVPAQFNGYVGAQFNASFTDRFGLGFGAGLDVIFGKLDKDADEMYFSLGAGAEILSFMKISDKVTLNLGFKAAYYFLITDEDFKKNAESLNSNPCQFTAMCFAGATYAF